MPLSWARSRRTTTNDDGGTAARGGNAYGAGASIRSRWSAKSSASSRTPGSGGRDVIRCRERSEPDCASLASATARSASRVNRGSVRAETARPRTNAKETWASVRSVSIWRSAASSDVTPIWHPHRRGGQGSLQPPLQDGYEASREAVARFPRRPPRDDCAGDSGASDRGRSRTVRASCGTRRRWREWWMACGSPALTQLVQNGRR